MSHVVISVERKKNAFNSEPPAFRISCVENAFEFSIANARNFDALCAKITHRQLIDRGASKIFSSTATRLAACIAFFFLTMVLVLDASAAPSLLNSVIAVPMVSASAVNLIWNPSLATNVTGYAVYYGACSRHYTNRIDVGLNVACTISGLASNQTYYFSANAYDAAGDESDFSNEIKISTAVTNAIIPVTTPTTNIVIVTIPMLSAPRLCAPWQTEAVFTLGYTNPAGNKFFTPGTITIANTSVNTVGTNIIVVTLPALSATNLSGPWQTEAVFTACYTNPAGSKFFTPGWLSITNSVQ